MGIHSEACQLKFISYKYEESGCLLYQCGIEDVYATSDSVDGTKFEDVSVAVLTPNLTPTDALGYIWIYYFFLATT